MVKDDKFIIECNKIIDEINVYIASNNIDKYEIEQLVGKIKGLNIAMKIYGDFING